ncbi:hypothetical protein, partial [Dysgonomonas reticulitermitis]
VGGAAAVFSNADQGNYLEALAAVPLAVLDLGTGGKGGAATKGKTILNFTKTTAKRMDNPGRYVPVQILDDAIKTTKGMPDPQGTRAFMHTTDMVKNGKTYKLEVLYDNKTNSIWHFQYSPLKK